MNTFTLEGWKKWVAHWIISGNKSIVCVQHLGMFNFFSDKHEPLEYTIHLDKENLPFIYFTDSQGDMGYRTCTLSKEPVQEVKIDAMTMSGDLDLRDEREEKRALIHEKINPISPTVTLQELVNMETVTLLNESEEIKTSRPERYASREVNGMDVIDLADHWDLSFPEANILKYLLRNKGEDISDLEKIIDYADRRIKQLNK